MLSYDNILYVIKITNKCYVLYLLKDKNSFKTAVAMQFNMLDLQQGLVPFLVVVEETSKTVDVASMSWPPFQSPPKRVIVRME